MDHAHNIIITRASISYPAGTRFSHGHPLRDLNPFSRSIDIINGVRGQTHELMRLHQEKQDQITRLCYDYHSCGGYYPNHMFVSESATPVEARFSFRTPEWLWTRINELQAERDHHAQDAALIESSLEDFMVQEMDRIDRERLQMERVSALSGTPAQVIGDVAAVASASIAADATNRGIAALVPSPAVTTAPLPDGTPNRAMLALDHGASGVVGPVGLPNPANAAYINAVASAMDATTADPGTITNTVRPDAVSPGSKAVIELDPEMSATKDYAGEGVGKSGD